MTEIPVSHPRYRSIIVREKLVRAYNDNLLKDEDLIDFGKEEAVDYFLGEKTTKIAYISYIIAIRDMFFAKKPALILDNISFILAGETLRKSTKDTFIMHSSTEGCNNNIENTHPFWGGKLLIGVNKKSFNEKLLRRLDIPYFEYSNTEDILDKGIDVLYYHKIERQFKELDNVKKIYFGLNLFSDCYYWSDLIILDNINRFFTNIEKLYFRLIKKDKERFNKLVERYSNIDFLKEYIKEMIANIRKMKNDNNDNI